MSQIPDRLTHVGPGWRPLLTELHEELVSSGYDYEVLQVKEKWGRLRVYISVDGEAHPFFDLMIPGYGSVTGIADKESGENWNSAMVIVHSYEHRSATICEECGEPGELRTDRPWIRTLCEGCADVRY